jgi:bacillithiol system protein YtxJ
MVIHPIESESGPAWQEELRRAPLALVYKHSPICGVSASARQEVTRFAEANPGVPVYGVDVLNERGLSRGLAEALGVRHASPQAILLRGGSPVWVASHLGVTAAALEGAVRAAEAGPETALDQSRPAQWRLRP